MKIKICGIKSIEEAKAAEELGADMIGFVFHESSKRYIEPKAAREISCQLPYSIQKVGVFVDREENDVIRIAKEALLDVMQFHGSESRDYCAFFKRAFRVIKAFRVGDAGSLEDIKEYPVDMYLLDTLSDKGHGGTGKVFDWSVLKGLTFDQPVILSGGLNPANVRKAIKTIRPFGVDVSTGVEKPEGGKDIELMKLFIENARKGFKDAAR